MLNIFNKIIEIKKIKNTHLQLHTSFDDIPLHHYYFTVILRYDWNESNELHNIYLTRTLQSKLKDSNSNTTFNIDPTYNRKLKERCRIDDRTHFAFKPFTSNQTNNSFLVYISFVKGPSNNNLTIKETTIINIYNTFVYILNTQLSLQDRRYRINCRELDTSFDSFITSEIEDSIKEDDISIKFT